MRPPHPVRRLAVAMVVVACAGGLRAQDPATALRPPANGPRQAPSRWYVLDNATVHPRPGEVLERTSVEVRDDTIVSVTPTASPSTATGIEHVDGTGLHVYAGFVDAFVEVEAPDGKPESPGAHWNSRVTPDRSALDGGGLDSVTAEALRKLGFGAACLAPKRGTFRGWAALASTAKRAEDLSGAPPPVLARDVWQVVSFERASGFGPGAPAAPAGAGSESTDATRWSSYPGSEMGAVALIRQTLMDADWRAACAASGAMAMPAASLDWLAKARGGRLVFVAEDELEVLRATKIAREFGREIVVVGSGTEFRRLDAIVADRPVLIVPVNTPTAPKVATVADQDAVELRELMTWEQAPTNLRRLDKAGLQCAVTTHGLRDRAKFFDQMRAAIKNGLAEDHALGMITTVPARLLGVGNRLGEISAGRHANLVVTDAPLFAEKTKIRDVIVDGRREQVNAPPAPEIAGHWDVVFDPAEPGELAMDLGNEPRVTVLQGGKESRAKDVVWKEGRLTFLVSDEPFGVPGFAAVAAVISGDSMVGEAVPPDGRLRHFTAKRTGPASRPAESRPDSGPDSAPASRPDGRRRGGRSDGGAENGPEARADSRPATESRPAAATPPESYGYPFGPYARRVPPTAPAEVIVTHATIWTCDVPGTLKDASLVVRDGKIVSIQSGPVNASGPGTRVIDASGRHVTPGIIDCHSHTGISRGVNEMGQAITAEVRVEDVTDPDAITWYRELAGGVTTVNSLHGSANAIGGQNCVNKIRWGALHPDDMHFAGAKAGIKFALGENPRGANGDRAGSRYPQTRLGVEALIRDRFTAAREYLKAFADFAAHGGRGAPPRRDLELEAIGEVLTGARLVHCHSYRQDEILMLCNLAGEFGFRIGTLQHILEGYKVAEAIKAHAMGASSFSDWWAYKMEVQDAIPENGAILHDVGIVVSFNSDSDELARRLNVEAAKAVKYGDVPPEEALKFVTLNPARQLAIDARVGSLAPGKDADFVIWSGDPLSTATRCEATWIDGREYFSLANDAEDRQSIASERLRIIQKILAEGDSGGAEARGPAAAGSGGRPGGRRRPVSEDGGRSGNERSDRPGDCGCAGQEGAGGR